MTTSPVTIPSPCSGRAPNATTASPVLIPIRTCSDERRIRLVQLLDRLQDAEPGPDGALGVVLVRDRSAEHRHHRVPDELLDRPAVALDLLPQARVVGADARAHVLGVGGIRGGGEADQVAEEHRHDLALLLHRAADGCSVSGARAERAERKLARELLAAGRASRHPPSLGQWRPGRGTNARRRARSAIAGTPSVCAFARGGHPWSGSAWSGPRIGVPA